MSEHSVTGGFAKRLAHLRALLGSDPPAAGDQGLKLLEEYLEYLALDTGYRNDTGSIGRYASWLRKRGPLSDAILDRVETYAQIRNCLAHSYGLQTSPALAAEIVDFLAAVIHQETATAAQMMSGQVRAIDESAPLREARDVMLRAGFSRLPVLRSGSVVGLLTERDLVAAEAAGERKGRGTEGLSVGAALPPNARRRVALVAATASYDVVVEALRRPGVEALIVTSDGRRGQKPLGIITHADVLYRM